MKDKLTELIAHATYDIDMICRERFQCDGCPAEVYGGKCKAGYIADRLIKSGVVISATENTTDNPYWKNICTIAEKQRAKGIETYGQGIEMNPADVITRIEYLQEELVDALMYCEWIKDSIRNVGEIEFDYNAEDMTN